MSSDYKNNHVEQDTIKMSQTETGNLSNMNSDNVKKAVEKKRRQIIQKIKDEVGKDWYADLSKTWLYRTTIKVKMSDGSTAMDSVFLPYHRGVQLKLNYWKFEKTPSMDITIKGVKYQIVHLGNGKYRQYKKDDNEEKRKTCYRTIIIKSVLDF